MKIIDAGDANGRAIMSRSDMNKMNIDDLDVVVMTDDRGNKAAIQVLSSDGCEEGAIQVDSTVLKSARISLSENIELRKSVVKGGIKEIHIGVVPPSATPMDRAIIWVAENLSRVPALLKNRPIFPGLEIFWEDAEIGPTVLKIMQTVPAIDQEETAIIDATGNEVILNIVPANEMNYNTILLIDVSGSMLKEDMVVKDVQGELERLRNDFKVSDEFNKFLDIFREGAVVSRISSAAIAALLYLDLKFKRGLGECVQIIAFGDDVEVLQMENAKGQMSPVIECNASELGRLNLNTVAYYISQKIKNASGLTAMSVALRIAHDQLAEFSKADESGRMSPTMIVMLSDGHPNKGDDAENIPVNPIPVAKQYLMRDDIVIFTIGIGEADDILMQKLATEGHGEYYRETSLKSFWQLYDNLAQKFMIAAKLPTSSNKVPVETMPPEQCPETTTEEAEPEAVPSEPVTEPAVPVKSKTPKVTSTAKSIKKDILLNFVATIGPGEKTVDIRVNPAIKIIDLKKMAGKLFGLDPNDFFLVYGGITLDEKTIVRECNFENGATVMLIPASTAGT
nr:VWA domain-containing protein [Candidatus Sigynarchaeota archaeon]